MVLSHLSPFIILAVRIIEILIYYYFISFYIRYSIRIAFGQENGFNCAQFCAYILLFSVSVWVMLLREQFFQKYIFNFLDLISGVFWSAKLAFTAICIIFYFSAVILKIKYNCIYSRTQLKLSYILPHMQILIAEAAYNRL